MFDRIDADVIKTLLIPLLEILSNSDYQKRVWEMNLDPSLSSSYGEFFLGFFEVCKNILSPGEENRLDEKSRDPLKILSEEVDEFYSSWLRTSGSDIH